MNKKRYEDNRRVNIVLDKKSREIGNKICAKYEMSFSGVIRMLFNNYEKNILDKSEKYKSSNENDIEDKEREELERLKALRRARKEGALND